MGLRNSDRLTARLGLGWQAARQLGLEASGLAAAYRIGLRLGLWRRLTPPGGRPLAAGPLQWNPVFRPVDTERIRDVLTPLAGRLVEAADEIVAGRVRLYGGPAVELCLAPPNADLHWTAAERAVEGDIKDIWEPARFGWVFTLVQAYHLTGSLRYPQAFWRQFETFQRHNPPNMGPNWASGQEVALRLMALAFALQHFPLEPAQEQAILRAIVEHARRIPPTLLYARAQRNNHLLTESAGLLTAGCLLAGHPEAASWKRLGWTWFDRGLLDQLEPDGTYAQHSTNYHRVMLHAALWVNALVQGDPDLVWPEAVRERLAASVRWLAQRMDPSGRAANLGHNDGANWLPPGGLEHGDYRPVLQAAGRAFLAESPLPAGPWDALSLYLGLPDAPRSTELLPAARPESGRLGDGDSWAILRAVKFHHRPAHADQLHVDLWWRGQNVLLDAGTYRYNAAPPWENALAGTDVHNTVCVEDSDQMLRAGKFLWLDWAQARWVTAEPQPGERLTAEHDGYRRMGIIHRRSLERVSAGHWRVADWLLPLDAGKQPGGSISCSLQWLLPDGEWLWLGEALRVTLPPGPVQVKVTVVSGKREEDLLVRGGERLMGISPIKPCRGWYSPTYSVKLPALSYRVRVSGTLPIQLQTDILLGES